LLGTTKLTVAANAFPQKPIAREAAIIDFLMLITIPLD